MSNPAETSVGPSDSAATLEYPDGQEVPQMTPWEAEPPTEDMTPEEQAQARVECVQEAADLALADGQIYTATVLEGVVSIQQVTSHTDGLGAWWVDVWLFGAILDGEPGWRIYNPPLLVPDPEGDTNVNGTMYRLDPMLALAQTVGANGGATKPRKR
jgi:hypothetical protein